MQVGLFDHVEHGDRPLTRLFDERLNFAVAAEAAGIYCLPGRLSRRGRALSEADAA
jgi:hypothetical protein